MKKKLKIQRTAHYHLQEGKNIRYVLYVVHGYGQLAEEFLQEFEFLKESPVLVVAPEAISKFYNKDRKAVANWMTSHEREDEIEDYVKYLEDLHMEIRSTYPVDDFSILGFSQGTSTALRWIKESNQKFENAYICSGAVPPEIAAGDLDHQKDCNFYYFYGDNDKLIEEERAKELIDRFMGLVNDLKVIPFKGRHEISNECNQLLLSHLT